MQITTIVAAVEPIASEGAKALSPTKVHQARALIPALAGLVILGLAMIAMVWWTAHSLRRRLRRRLGASRPIHDDWYRKAAPNDASSDASSNDPDEPRP